MHGSRCLAGRDVPDEQCRAGRAVLWPDRSGSAVARGSAGDPRRRWRCARPPSSFSGACTSPWAPTKNTTAERPPSAAASVALSPAGTSAAAPTETASPSRAPAPTKTTGSRPDIVADDRRLVATELQPLQRQRASLPAETIAEINSRHSFSRRYALPAPRSRGSAALPSSTIRPVAVHRHDPRSTSETLAFCSTTSIATPLVDLLDDLEAALDEDRRRPIDGSSMSSSFGWTSARGPLRPSAARRPTACRPAGSAAPTRSGNSVCTRSSSSFKSAFGPQ